MKFVSIWKDELFSVPSGGSEPFKYEITYGDEIIFLGKAYRFESGATINVTKIIRDWVYMHMPEFLEIDGDFAYHDEAMRTFNLMGTDGTLYETYVYLFNSSDDWNGEDMMISDPINAHADPRQKIFFSYASLSGATVDIDISELYFYIEDAVATRDGGYVHIRYNTNYYDDEFYIVVPSGVTLVSYGDGDITVSLDPNYGLEPLEYEIKVYRVEDDVLLGTSTLIQNGIGYLNSDEYVIVPYSAATTTIHIDTNIPLSALTYTVPSGVTAVSFTSTELVVSVPLNDDDSYVDYVRFYYLGEILLDTTELRVRSIYDTYKSEYLTIEVTGDNAHHVAYNPDTVDPPSERRTYFSKNGGEWTTSSINVQKGDIVRVKGNWTQQVPYNKGIHVYEKAVGLDEYVEAEFNVYGNILSLVFMDNFADKDYSLPSFGGLFGGSYVVDASRLVFPKERMNTQFPSTYLIEKMFKDCTHLLYAPHTLDLNILPNMPRMFEGCTSLIKAPKRITAVRMYVSSCFSAFKGCVSLEKSPEISISDAKGSYTPLSFSEMFSGCTSLCDVTYLGTPSIQSYATFTDWMAGVSPTGVFKKRSDVTFPTGDSGIPTGWTVEAV